MKNQDCTALTLLDLSAAFDTLDHQILLDRLKEWFGLDGVTLELVVSYLKHGFPSVQISSIRSNPIKLIVGAPQGSVLGPLLFIMYTTLLSSVLSKAKGIDIKHHLYADDTQVHNSFNTSSFEKYTQNIQNSLVSVQDWMYKNKLKLNSEKKPNS